jgi:hypothetical protein
VRSGELRHLFVTVKLNRVGKPGVAQGEPEKHFWTRKKGFNLSYQSLMNSKAHKLLLEQVSTDNEFYKSLKRSDEGKEDQDGNDDDNNGKLMRKLLM